MISSCATLSRPSRGREEGFSDEEIPNDLNGIDRSPKELAEVPRLPVGRPDGTGHPVLDVPCLRLPINVVDVVVVAFAGKKRSLGRSVAVYVVECVLAWFLAEVVFRLCIA